MIIFSEVIAISFVLILIEWIIIGPVFYRAMLCYALLWPGVHPSVCHVRAFYPDG